jgi:HK97 family phage prohead protease
VGFLYAKEYMQYKQDNLEHESTRLTVTKAKSLPHGQFEAILSTDDLDRHGEKVSQTGLNIPKDQTIKMYYNHETNGTSLPIGKWNKVWKSAGKLMGLGEIDIEDEFAVKVYKKILKGYIDSISIGFFPQEFDGETATWTKSTLVEASVVAEPANVAARITSKDLGFSQEEFNKSLKVKLKEVVLEPAEDPFVGEPGTPPQSAVSSNAPHDGVAPPTEGDDNENTDDNSKDGAVHDELKAAFEELKSRMDALEAAKNSPTDEPTSKKQLINVRLAFKQVGQIADNGNRIMRIKLKETN